MNFFQDFSCLCPLNCSSVKHSSFRLPIPSSRSRPPTTVFHPHFTKSCVVIQNTPRTTPMLSTSKSPSCYECTNAAAKSTSGRHATFTSEVKHRRICCAARLGCCLLSSNCCDGGMWAVHSYNMGNPDFEGYGKSLL